MNDVSIDEVVRNPDWLPHSYDPDGHLLTFVNVPRNARSELMFLFDQHYGGKFTKISFPGASVAAAVRAERDSERAAPAHFIFHTSFCGSSLLARALEMPGVATSMREPAVFTSLANRVTSKDDQASADRLELILRLLERPFFPNEAVIAKQSTFANRLIEPILRSRENNRAILLYGDLETYLVSLLKRGVKGRIWGRKLFVNIRSWSKLELDLDDNEIMELTDVQVAALAWLMQIHHFDRLAKEFGPRTMLVESSELFASPTATLHSVMTFFGLCVTREEAAQIVSGPVFAKHSKFSDRDYSVEQRQRDTQIVGKANSEEISMVANWLQAFARHHGVELRPSSREQLV